LPAEEPLVAPTDPANATADIVITIYLAFEFRDVVDGDTLRDDVVMGLRTDMATSVSVGIERFVFVGARTGSVVAAFRVTGQSWTPSHTSADPADNDTTESGAVKPPFLLAVELKSQMLDPESNLRTSNYTRSAFRLNIGDFSVLPATTPAPPAAPIFDQDWFFFSSSAIGVVIAVLACVAIGCFLRRSRKVGVKKRKHKAELEKELNIPGSQPPLFSAWSR
jgi:hypothetical protein